MLTGKIWPQYGGEQDEAVGAAEHRLAGALRMRHEPDDVAFFVADAGDVVDGAVRVRQISDVPLRVAVAEDDPPGRLELPHHLGVGVVVALAVRNGNPQHLATRRKAGERGI